MPRRKITCDSYVFDALVFDRYNSGSTNAADLRRRLDIVYRAMKNELTPLQFAALKEYYVQGKKMREIAEDMGVHPSTITRRIQRAKEKITHITSYY